MVSNKRRDTSIELNVRRILHAEGMRRACDIASTLRRC